MTLEDAIVLRFLESDTPEWANWNAPIAEVARKVILAAQEAAIHRAVAELRRNVTQRLDTP